MGREPNARLWADTPHPPAGSRLPAHGPATLSVSRCGMAAAVAMTRGVAVGIDIERVTAHLVPAAHTYLHVAEARHLRGPASATVATTMWALKEAVLKALGVGLTEPPIRVHLRPGLRRGRRQWRWRTPSARGRALSWRRGAYVIALAIRDEDGR